MDKAKRKTRGLAKRKAEHQKKNKFRLLAKHYDKDKTAKKSKMRRVKYNRRVRQGRV